jgi:hypothetical protein
MSDSKSYSQDDIALLHSLVAWYRWKLGKSMVFKEPSIPPKLRQEALVVSKSILQERLQEMELLMYVGYIYDFCQTIDCLR